MDFYDTCACRENLLIFTGVEPGLWPQLSAYIYCGLIHIRDDIVPDGLTGPCAAIAQHWLIDVPTSSTLVHPRASAGPVTRLC